MTVPQRGSEIVELDGGPLGLLTFSWRDDRYQHTWTFPTCETHPALSIASVESGSEEHWPLSPPLQQIHSQSFGDGREVIFGVGMAGRGHWSASFTLVPDLKCWIVELACKCPTDAECLQSSYSLASEHSMQLSGSECCLSPAHNVFIEAIAPSTIAGLESSTIRFAPKSLASAATIQWAFKVRVGS